VTVGRLINHAPAAPDTHRPYITNHAQALLSQLVILEKKLSVPHTANNSLTLHVK